MESKDTKKQLISNKLKEEYAAFGPWIFEIRDAIDIPTVFEGKIDLTNDTIIAIKIPKEIERRNAKEGMHLYNYVLILKANDLEIHKRIGDDVRSTILSYNDIMAVQNMVDLLNGELTLYHKKGISTLNYNTTSKEIIDKIVYIMRSKMNHSIEGNPCTYLNENILEMSFLYKTLLKRAQLKEDLHILGMQPATKTKIINPTLWEKFSSVFFKYILRSSLFLTNGNDLIILHRQNTVSVSTSPDYSHASTIIPLSSIHSMSIEPNRRYTNINNLLIRIEPEPIVFKIGTKVDFESWVNTIL
ncbi:MAG: hypothetical protein PF505_03770 [Vallitaleaceae bacterium]|nr:hypothetical protein [Vallitaleaceae bacterium]